MLRIPIGNDESQMLACRMTVTRDYGLPWFKFDIVRSFSIVLSLSSSVAFDIDSDSLFNRR